MGKEVTAKLMNDICRCTGGTEIDGEVKAYRLAEERLHIQSILTRVAQESAQSGGGFLDYLHQRYNVDVVAVRLETIKPDDANQVEAKAALVGLLNKPPCG